MKAVELILERSGMANERKRETKDTNLS
jgi:hypothetical protein